MMPVVRLATMVLYHGFIGLSIPNHIFFAFSGNLSGSAGLVFANFKKNCNKSIDKLRNGVYDIRVIDIW